MKRLTHILFLTLCIVQLYAAPHVTRNYAYRHFTTRDGLVQMQVMCAFQDKDGYMWFGTKGGVSRFDGISFKNYTPDKGLPFGEISNITEWGLLKLFFSHRKMVILYPDDSIKVQSLPDSMIFNKRENLVIPLDNNRLMFCTLANEYGNNGNPKSGYSRYVYYLNEKKFVLLKGFDEVVIRVDHNFVYTTSGVFNWDGKYFKRILTFPYKVFWADFKPSKKSCILYDENLFKAEGFYVNKSGFKSKWAFKTNPFVSVFIVLKNGTFLYQSNNQSKFIPARFASLKNNIAIPNNLYEDKEGNLWICTENGLYNYFNLNIEEIKLNVADPDNVWSIVEDIDKSMWFGCFGNGLWVLNKKNGMLSKKDYTANLSNKFKASYKMQYMGSTLGADSAIYMTSFAGLTKFKNGKCEGSSNTTACLYSFYDEKLKNILYSGFDSITNRRGLFKGLDKNKKFYPFSKGYPVCIAKDSYGRIRIGGFQGHGVFTGNSIVQDTTRHEYEGIVCMASDNKNRLWKGTEKGLYVELPDGREFHVSRRQLTGMLTSIVVYKNKYVIACGTQGFSLVDIRDIRNYDDPIIVNISYDSGFTGLESGQNDICIASDGYVWLGTALNVLRFHPEIIMSNHTTHIPPLRITNMAYSEDNIQWEMHYFQDKSVIVSSKNKFFRIDYIANSISAPRLLRFRYRLIGLSDKWSEPVYTKSVYYTNIGYGKYRFEVQCSMNGINWSPTSQSPEIEITAPFYLTPVAFLLYLLFIIVLSIYLTKVYLNRKQAKQLQEISRQKLENELQLNTLRSKVIPHFTKNVLSAIGHFAMTDKLKAGHYISVFSKFTGLTLANADKNYIALSDELEYIEKYLELEKMRFGDNFEYKISIENDVPLQIFIPSMTLHTYCDNAIRHGLVNKIGTGFLTVQIQDKTDGVMLIVLDNGIGRKRAAELGTQGNGQGLKLIQAQMDFYNQKNQMKMTQEIIDLENNVGNSLGTRIELFIPKRYMFL